MTFSLINTSVSFQVYVNSVLNSMSQDQVMVFLNDILIMKDICEKLHQNICEVLMCLQVADLYVKLEKCYFKVIKVSFLGFILTPEGVHMDPSHIIIMLK